MRRRVRRRSRYAFTDGAKPPTRRRARRERIVANRHRRRVRHNMMKLRRMRPEYARPSDHHFGRDGWPISFIAWTIHFEDALYRQIRLTRIGGGVLVSTIWLGLGDCSEPPLIFETATRQRGRTVIRTRYATEAEAIAGHEHYVALMRAEALNARPHPRVCDRQDADLLATARALLQRAVDLVPE